MNLLKIILTHLSAIWELCCSAAKSVESGARPQDPAAGKRVARRVARECCGPQFPCFQLRCAQRQNGVLIRVRRPLAVYLVVVSFVVRQVALLKMFFHSGSFLFPS